MRGDRLHSWAPGSNGVWEKLHALLLAELHACDRLERGTIADSSQLRAKKGAKKGY